MKHVIIGTAGHVDHGKTVLTKALTGIDTDRLKEEKRRGITIEPGFAYLDFDDNTRAGIIDVPGHERFIRNMLAGAGGIDLCMLVVAADEGVMPQTVEHLGILTLLGIKNGVVVITKTDLADEDWLELILSDIRDFVKGTFLENAPVIPVSAHTGAGLDTLKSKLRQMLDTIEEKNTRVPFRLPIDRVFPVDGFGTVVTGTLIEGCVHVGDAAEILPSGLSATVRAIQVHGCASESAYGGQRVALNLAGVKKSEISKGDVAAKRGAILTASALDVRLELLPEIRRTIKNASSLHLYHGTRVALCKVYLLDRAELLPGQSCYARLSLYEKLPCKTGDRFVVRFYSPLETIGGGVILDRDPKIHKRRDESVLSALAVREKGSGAERVYQAAAAAGRLIRSESLRKSIDMPEDEFKDALVSLAESGRLSELMPERYIADSALDLLADSCRTVLKAYHKANPLHSGLRVAELRQKLKTGADITESNAILGELSREGILRIVDGRAALPDFEVRLTSLQKAVREKILEIYKNAGYDTPPPADISAMLDTKLSSETARVTESLLNSGELVMLSKQIYWHRETFDKACATAQEHFKSNRELSMPQFRDMLGASRKYALAMLDYLDSAHVTKKTGDIRTLFKGFDVLR